MNHRAKPVKLSEDTISLTDLKKLSAWLDTNPQLTKGPVTYEFEKEFAAKVDSEHAVFVNSGSSANLLVAAALKASGRLRNDTVVCPAVSWVTTVTPFTQLGFEVVLCDAEFDTLGLDVVALERIFIEHNPALCVLVHVLGHPNDLETIVSLCEKYDVILVEDTCEALGSVHTNGSTLGTLGLAGTFSFYYGHHISTIEGGIVVTDDFEFYELMLSLRSHGWSRDLSIETRQALQKEHNIDHFRELYSFFYEGFNFRSTDLQAFIGLLQLPKLDRIIDAREENFFQYRRLLNGWWSQKSPATRLSSFGYGLLVENPLELSDALRSHHIESRPLICGNIARQPFWHRTANDDRHEVADTIHSNGMYLPNHPGIDSTTIARVTQVVNEVGRPLLVSGG